MWSMWRDAVSFLDDKGTVYTLKDNEGKAKYLQQFPQVGIMNNLASQLSKLEDSFGMTPSARAGLVVDKKKKDSGKSRFFNKVG